MGISWSAPPIPSHPPGPTPATNEDASESVSGPQGTADTVPRDSEAGGEHSNTSPVVPDPPTVTDPPTPVDKSQEDLADTRAPIADQAPEATDTDHSPGKADRPDAPAHQISHADSQDKVESLPSVLPPLTPDDPSQINTTPAGGNKNLNTSPVVSNPPAAPSPIQVDENQEGRADAEDPPTNIGLSTPDTVDGSGNVDVHLPAAQKKVGSTSPLSPEGVSSRPLESGAEDPGSKPPSLQAAGTSSTMSTTNPGNDDRSVVEETSTAPFPASNDNKVRRSIHRLPARLAIFLRTHIAIHLRPQPGETSGEKSHKENREAPGLADAQQFDCFVRAIREIPDLC